MNDMLTASQLADLDETRSPQVRLPELDETRAPQVRRLIELRARAAGLRDSVSQLSDEADRLHTHVQGADLDRLAAQLVQSDPQDLLATASEGLGMSWNLLARLVGVSATAIRKWRRGTAAVTPENRRRLAFVVAFCEVLGELNPRIVDPALWLETPLAATTTLTPADLFAAGHANALLDIASERETPTAVLDAVAPGWTKEFPADTSFTVIEAADGLPSIIPAS